MRSLSLINRVSLFFIGALALVLVAYSAVMYFVLARQLAEQFDEQLHAAFRTLIAAVEVESDDVKFETSDHTIALGRGAGEDEIRWVVVDEQGLLVDRSRNLLAVGPSEKGLLDYATTLHTDDDDSVEVGRWRVLQRRLAAVQPKAAAERDPLEREALVVTVARSPDELNRSLRFLAATVTILPLVVGAAAAVIVRRLCRRALEPVRAMASEARAMAAADADRRLAVAPSGDELAELGEAFNGVLDRLFATLARQQRFAGDAAHQLRTPLTAVIGQLDVALRRTRTPEEYRETMTIVREQADELQRLVESLLFLARAENDAVLPDTETLVADAWLRDYADSWSTHPRHADLQFNSGGPTTVRASRVLLKQLLDNLVGNALKYSEPGRSVSVTARSVDGEWELAVTDEGIGISPDDLAAVFQPFFRSAEARRSGTAGTGLGLAVAARIAAALGGRLTCMSQLGRGSRFTLTLPLI